MSTTSVARFRVAIVLIAPVVLGAGLIYHPYVARLTDSQAVGSVIAADTARWGLAHLVIAVGYGLLALAFLAIRSYLHEAGEDRWSILALPAIILGSTMIAILPGMEFAPLAAAETGNAPSAAQDALQSWFVPVLLLGGGIFALGALGFAMGIVRSRVLGSGLTWLVVGGLLVMVVFRFVPLGVGQYVIAAAGLVGLWPLAYRMREQPQVRPAARPVVAEDRRRAA